jgi:hypothetical protein
MAAEFSIIVTELNHRTDGSRGVTKVSAPAAAITTSGLDLDVALRTLQHSRGDLSKARIQLKNNTSGQVFDLETLFPR